MTHSLSSVYGHFWKLQRKTNHLEQGVKARFILCVKNGTIWAFGEVLTQSNEATEGVNEYVGIILLWGESSNRFSEKYFKSRAACCLHD